MPCLIRSSFRASVLTVGLLLTGCGDDPVGSADDAGSPENVSRVVMTFTPVGGGAAVSSSRADADGSQGPQLPQTSSGTLVLHKGITYNGVIGMLNDLGSGSPVDLTAEIGREANFHRVFYTFSCADVSIPVSSMNRDTQSTSQPLGTTFQVVVGAEAPGTENCVLNVQVHHFLDKGTGTGSTYETDLNMNFPVSVLP